VKQLVIIPDFLHDHIYPFHEKNGYANAKISFSLLQSETPDSLEVYYH